MKEIIRAHGRNDILKTAHELRRIIGRPVLIMAGWGEHALIAPGIPPRQLQRKNREGVLLPPTPVAFSVQHDPALFDVVGILGIALTQDVRGGGHVAQLPGNRHFIDLMSEDPDQLRGEGQVLLVDGAGWIGECFDSTFGEASRYVLTPEGSQRGGPVILGIGSLTRNDLSLEIRREADPSMVHYLAPDPIPFG